MKLITMAVMKRMVQLIALTLAVMLFSAGSVCGQETTSAEKAKQKELEELKKIQMEAEKDMQMDAKKEYERQKRDIDEIRMRAEDMSRKSLIMIPEAGTWNIAAPHLDSYYFYDTYSSSKPGSSWNYSRQVMEASFTNEFTMDAGGEDGNVSLSVSGNCAEGAISVAIIMPDGKPLSEVVIDANGSLNWRKSFEENEGSNWKNGKWIFRIKAQAATGNFRISMTSN
ncbi:MAG: hypothetical protein MUC78_12625 [Bacteroidales bacterium]|jgi:hypothetical protein|nr:hypothetical protein [Bacteroidales bacterium]